MNEELADLIEEASEMGLGEAIDPVYLIEAIEKDLRAGTPAHTRELINNPVS